MEDWPDDQLRAGELPADHRAMTDHELVALVVAVAALVRAFTALLRVLARARAS